MSMKCPKCRGKTKIVDSRQKAGYVTRRYECVKECGTPRWTTIEVFSHYNALQGVKVIDNVSEVLKQRLKKKMMAALKNS